MKFVRLCGLIFLTLSLNAADSLRFPMLGAKEEVALLMEEAFTTCVAAKSSDLSAHVLVLNDCFPPLTTAQDLKAKRDLLVYIEGIYGANLAANSDFQYLIIPLIKIGSDPAQRHMDFVMSDQRVSCLRLYAEKMENPIFSYDEIISTLRSRPYAAERYEFFMMTMSSFSHDLEISRMVWANIFNLTGDQFDLLEKVAAALNRDHALKQAYMPTYLQQMFVAGQWDPKVWKIVTTPKVHS